MTLPASASLVRWIGAPMAVGELLPLAIRLAAEVAELHGRGAVHGDLNPARIQFLAALHHKRSCSSSAAPSASS